MPRRAISVTLEADNVTWGCAGELNVLYDDPDVPSVFDLLNFDDLFEAPVPPPPVAPPVEPPPALEPDPPVVPPPGGGGL